MFQASAVDFLCKYDFDFNKFFKEGIPYINEAQEHQLHEEIKDGTIQYTYRNLMDLSSRRKLDVQINSFVNMTSIPKSVKSCAGDESAKEVEQLVLEQDSLCPVYFQLNELRYKYPSLWAYAENNKIIVKKVSPEQRKEFESQLQSEEELLLNYFLGFTKVFRILKKAKKPMVGHNVLMDLLLFMNSFHNPLPDTYKEFKKELHSLFPVLYDTRHIWRHVKKHYKLKDIPKQCGLFELQEMFQRLPKALATLYSPDFQHCNGEKYLNGEFPHESGYDSFVTGWVFLKICHVLAMQNIKSTVHAEPQTLKQHLKAVQPFVNKLNIGRSREFYIDVENADPMPVVPDLLHISRKDGKPILNQTQLSRLLNNYGMIDVKLLSNKKGAVIAVGSLGSYKDILRGFGKNDEFVVTKYSVLKHTPAIQSALWLTVAGTSCVVAFLVFKLFS
ncbi:pre-piRNA 3'-exonuclease trimmer-like isoform X2 [Uloborus diversus]|nr:pre-piRNA 3'-exonuclease trimmer-like isoform X2 [Uloborus diversus]